MMNPWTWIVLAVIFGVVELLNFELTMCWFLVGALVAFVVALCDLPWIFQIIMFLFTAIMSLIFFKPLAKDYFKIGAVQTNVPALIGQVGVVREKISPYHLGTITVHGQIWSAESVVDETIEINEKVKIMGIEGVILKVQKLTEGEKRR
ncbi:MAG TPA: NfeD family protein [Clostridia bacterium]|jgi:membrane protein implicated in regulation of membrane protease activity|nr:NfeD family protein [Clostridia bacterium]HHY06241.1 NfeD family protein [Clostridia bacterium]